jgi:hypothetical protein
MFSHCTVVTVIKCNTTPLILEKIENSPRPESKFGIINSFMFSLVILIVPDILNHPSRAPLGLVCFWQKTHSPLE